MKRSLQICALILLVALLAGCTDWVYTTDEYKTYQTIARLHTESKSIAKQRVLDTLGCPDGYLDSQGTYWSIPIREREQYYPVLLGLESTAWVYECNKRPDPAEPYRLQIFFDAEGNSTAVAFNCVPGG